MLRLFYCLYFLPQQKYKAIWSNYLYQHLSPEIKILCVATMRKLPLQPVVTCRASSGKQVEKPFTKQILLVI